MLVKLINDSVISVDVSFNVSTEELIRAFEETAVTKEDEDNDNE